MALVTLYRLEHHASKYGVFNHPKPFQNDSWVKLFTDYMIDAIEGKTKEELVFDTSFRSFNQFLWWKFMESFPGPMDDYIVKGNSIGALIFNMRNNSKFACFSKENFLQWFPAESIIVFVEDHGYRIVEIEVEEKNVLYSKHQALYFDAKIEIDITAEFLKGL